MDRSFALPLSIGGAGAVLCLFAAFATWRTLSPSDRNGAPVATILGASMAETLHGETVEGECVECGFPLRFHVAALPPSGEPACPNCGASNDASRLRFRPPDQVALRALAEDESPQIGRLYVMAAPDGEGKDPIVKRVVAGPGERVSLAGGELFRDGELVRKDLRDVFPTVVVYDDAYLPQRSGMRTSNWRRTSSSDSGSRFEFSPRAVWSSVDPSRASPVLDWHPSVAVERRRLNRVPDVWVETNLRRDGPGDTIFGYRSAERERRIVVSDEGDWTFDAGEGAEAPQQGTIPDWSRQELLGFGMLDRRLFIQRAPGDVVISLAPERDLTPVEAPLAIEIEGTGDAIPALGQVRRDVHYLSPLGNDDPWSEPADANLDGWFVLGDNPGGSIDSRQFGRVSREAFLGEVVLPVDNSR